MEETTKTTRGGFRVGAGRPKGSLKPDKKKPFTFKLSVEEEKAVRELLAKMRGKLVIAMAILLLGLSVNAMTLTGGVEERAQYAKEYAFKELPLRIDIKLLDPYLYDPDRHENLQILKGFAKAANRTVFQFNVKSKIVQIYGVQYKNNPRYEYIYYWGILGNVNIAYTDYINKYPYKVAQYNNGGKLMSIFTFLSKDEQYHFDKNGNIKGYWINHQYYDNKNNVKMTRKRLLNFED